MAGPQRRDDLDLFFWLALAMAPGIGARLFARLIRKFKSPEAVFRASAVELSGIARIKKTTVAALKRFDWAERVEKELESANRRGIKLVTLGSPDYPERLKQIADPPPVLWVAGDLMPEDEVAVSIVGSRSATEYGRITANRLAVELASVGVRVVSGVALGIDAAAHRGAIASGGRTFGVLGCGLDVIYPRANRDLFGAIPKNGALISEFPLGTQPKPGHFPLRNRVIAGLSMAVVVVEAARRSGALITARIALDENRDVLAVPGRVGSLNSQGANDLLKQGAKLIETGQDIVEDIVPQLAGQSKPFKPAIVSKKEPALDPDELKVYRALKEDPLHIDSVGREIGWDPVRLSPVLLELELKGLVKQLPGMRYIKVNG